MSVPISEEQYFLDKLDAMKRAEHLSIKMTYIYACGKVENEEMKLK